MKGRNENQSKKNDSDDEDKFIEMKEFSSKQSKNKQFDEDSEQSESKKTDEHPDQAGNYFKHLPNEVLLHILSFIRSENRKETLRDLKAVSETDKQFHQVSQELLEKEAEVYLPNPVYNEEGLAPNFTDKQSLLDSIAAFKVNENRYYDKKYHLKFYKSPEEARNAPDMHKRKTPKEILIFYKGELIGFFDSEGKRKTFLTPLEEAKECLIQIGKFSMDELRNNGYPVPINPTNKPAELDKLRKEAAAQFVEYRLSKILTSVDQIRQLKQMLSEDAKNEFKYIKKNTGLSLPFISDGYNDNKFWNRIMVKLDELVKSLPEQVNDSEKATSAPPPHFP
ncbi:F-box protein [Legionella sp. CNM-1927-20]|uniref:F-box protein n=1 Tax=Legionella sp. CNM-1927-20 TaxID=3422221 RepID=UPI00403AFF96